MKTYDIALEDGEVQLRLTMAKLQKYLEKIGMANMAPLLGVLDAVSNLDKKIQLLTAALTWPGNSNKAVTLDGADLLDRLVDEGMGQADINGVILALALDAGLVDEDQQEALAQALDQGNEALFSTILDAMTGNADDTASSGGETTPEENPTGAPGSGN